MSMEIPHEYNTPHEAFSPNHVWTEVRSEAVTDGRIDPVVRDYLQHFIVDQTSLEAALSSILSNKLTSDIRSKGAIEGLFREYWETANQDSLQATAHDLIAIRDRDPACSSLLIALLYMKGFHALVTHRVAHWLWSEGRIHAAYHMQNAASEKLSVDIHPAAKIGSGLVIDHATNVVVGETSVIGDNVTLLQGVTLGGTGKATGDRHPKVGQNVQIWAGAKVLGNVKLGAHCQIGACSVVLSDVPEYTTAVGVPARVVNTPSRQTSRTEGAT